MAVVGFDDLDVVAGGKRLRRHLQQLEGDVDAHTHVGRHDDGDVARGLLDLALVRLGKAGGADDQVDTARTAGRHMRHRAFGPGEVDQHLRLGQALGQVVRNGYTAGVPQKGAGIVTQGDAARDVEGAGQGAVGCVAQGFDQHVPHAARRASDCDPVRGR